MKACTMYIGSIQIEIWLLYVIVIFDIYTVYITVTIFVSLDSMQ